MERRREAVGIVVIEWNLERLTRRTGGLELGVECVIAFTAGESLDLEVIRACEKMLDDEVIRIRGGLTFACDQHIAQRSEQAGPRIEWLARLGRINNSATAATCVVVCVALVDLRQNCQTTGFRQSDLEVADRPVGVSVFDDGAGRVDCQGRFQAAVAAQKGPVFQPLKAQRASPAPRTSKRAEPLSRAPVVPALAA